MDKKDSDQIESSLGARVIRYISPFTAHMPSDGVDIDIDKETWRRNSVPSRIIMAGNCRV